MSSPVFTAVVQARMGSVRLEGKSLADLSGKPLLFHVLQRTSMVKGVSRTVLATGEGKENLPLVSLAEKMGLDAVSGPEQNVLKRFCMAAEKFPCDYVVRVTGDNPFTDIFYAEKTVEMALETSADLCSFSNLPLGTAVEIVKTEVLFEALELADKTYHFEHVTPFIKEHPDRYRIIHREAVYENPFRDLRLTVDTSEDLRLASEIYAGLYRGEPFGIPEIIVFLKNHPDIVSINSHVEQKPMTSFEKVKTDI